MQKIKDSKIQNLIPYQGEAYYYGNIFEENVSEKYFDILLNTVPWQNDSVKIFGKTIVTNRKMAWYSTENQSYTYSNSTKMAMAFTTELWEIKQIVENISGEKYNACLLNFYKNGQESMGWHTDNEREIVAQSAIASVSLGANRRFCFRHKTIKEKLEVQLENGSLLVMKGLTQQYWQHSLPKSAKVNEPRINLTFRQMV